MFVDSCHIYNPGRDMIGFCEPPIHNFAWAEHERSRANKTTHGVSPDLVGSNHFNDFDVSGEGTAWYASGNRYVGQWRNGKSHGEGIYYYATDARYEGQFDGGKCHGRGTYFYANGNK